MNPYKEALNRFSALYEKVLQAKLHEPTAMTVSTAGPDGQPRARTVLLKDFSEDGFVFYTNKTSRKGADLKTNPKASLLFYWPDLQMQVLIEGTVSDVSEEEADAYWRTRPRESQIGGWASLQSQPLEDREALMSRYSDYEKNFGNAEIPRPPHWSGYVVKPTRLEFWRAGSHRLHERTVYEEKDGGWTVGLVYP